MQPNQPYAPPPTPNYDFLNQTTKKPRKIPLAGNSMVGKIFIAVFCVTLLLVLFAVVKSLITTAPFNNSDYVVLLDRQQEMLHILSVDVTQQNFTLLSPADQNFASTTQSSLTTAQQKTLEFMHDYKEKVNTVKLAKVYDSAIDQNLTSAQSTNTFDSTFKSEMSDQLSSYEQELKTAYLNTKVAGGRTLLRDENAEAKLLVTALSSPTS